jgi:hypothetical protein
MASWESSSVSVSVFGGRWLVAEHQAVGAAWKDAIEGLFGGVDDAAAGAAIRSVPPSWRRMEEAGEGRTMVVWLSILPDGLAALSVRVPCCLAAILPYSPAAALSSHAAMLPYCHTAIPPCPY